MRATLSLAHRLRVPFSRAPPCFPRAHPCRALCSQTGPEGSDDQKESLDNPSLAEDIEKMNEQLDKMVFEDEHNNVFFEFKPNEHNMFDPDYDWSSFEKAFGVHNLKDDDFDDWEPTSDFEILHSSPGEELSDDDLSEIKDRLTALGVPNSNADPRHSALDGRDHKLEEIIARARKRASTEAASDAVTAVTTAATAVPSSVPSAAHARVDAEERTDEQLRENTAQVCATPCADASPAALADLRGASAPPPPPPPSTQQAAPNAFAAATAGLAALLSESSHAAAAAAAQLPADIDDKLSAAPAPSQRAQHAAALAGGATRKLGRTRAARRGMGGGSGSSGGAVRRAEVAARVADVGGNATDMPALPNSVRRPGYERRLRSLEAQMERLAISALTTRHVGDGGFADLGGDVRRALLSADGCTLSVYYCDDGVGDRSCARWRATCRRAGAQVRAALAGGMYIKRVPKVEMVRMRGDGGDVAPEGEGASAPTSTAELDRLFGEIAAEREREGGPAHGKDVGAS